ncbi:MAG: type VI secretion system lipoprotein TssJ [Gammaproteobacteria bacterium]|nr:type VI secretion system lipoprotein TssJ [Gammaproteobacteria bacterium]
MTKENIINWDGTKRVLPLLMLSVLFCLLLLLSGCASMQPDGKTVQINTYAAHYLNPDINGRSSPVVVTFFQLKNGYSFSQADYQTLSNNSSKALGGDLLDQTTVEIRPGTGKTIPLTVSNNANYIGIMAAYRNINNGIWHKAIKLAKAPGSQTVINLNLQSQGITTQTGKAQSMWHWFKK